MKYAMMLATVVALAASPALAGGKGKGSLIASLVPITTTVGNVSALNNTKVSALNNISVLNGNLSGNTVKAPVSLKKIGVLGGFGYGCGCN